MLNKRIVEQRVARGARFYDERLPGWPKKLNLHVLEMYNPFYCVIAQLEGPNWQWNKILPSIEARWELGFMPPLPCTLPFSELVEYYRLLGEFWKEEVNRRLYAAD